MQKDLRRYVLVVEDHPLVAESLVAWVKDCDSWLDVAVSDSLRAAARTLALRPDPFLIVTDLTLTDTRGIETVRRLREIAPRSQILVFTALDEAQLRKESVELGVVAYVVKSASTQTLRETMDKIIGVHRAQGPAAEEQSETQRPLLTRKQRSVLNELVAGRSNKEIAARLNISDKTVNSHMKEIFSRLGAKNRTEAVVRYLSMGNQRNDRTDR